MKTFESYSVIVHAIIDVIERDQPQAGIVPSWQPVFQRPNGF